MVEAYGVMDADGSDLVNVSMGDKDAAPAWSPDGETIAFARLGAHWGSGQIHFMNADGSDQRNISK